MKEVKFRAWNRDDNKPMFNPISMLGVRFEVILAVPSIAVMQYTGLNDKDGKEIYEGDILKAYGKEITQFIVSFSNGSFVLYHQFGRWGLLSRLFELNDMSAEIIGNIHENSELCQ